MAECLIDYYQTLLSSMGNINPEEIISTILCLINSSTNDQLNFEFMSWELQATLKQMATLKALGLDGMLPLFYQNYWNLVGTDVTQFVLSFLNSSSLPHHLNHTFITPIPEVNKLKLVS